MSNKTKRLCCFVASMICSIGVPLVVVVWRYHMLDMFLQQTTTVKVSIVGAIICLILFAVFFKKILKYLSSLEFSYGVCILKGIVKLVPMVCILLILVNMMKFIDDLIFVSGWIVGCNAISILIFDPLVDKFNYEAKRDAQRKIVQEGLANGTRTN